MDKDSSHFKKIRFPLQKDEHGYPPVESELIWSRVVNEHSYSIESIPFFVNLLALGDVVVAKPNEFGELQYIEHESYSRHSTIRIFFKVNSNETVKSIRDRLNDIGCSSELAEIGPLAAVDIPPPISVESVRNLLSNFEIDGSLSVEEACVWD